ncbi:uncharacterized protein F5147DRAFT_275486 [Suillus discolor]|uniref:Uncharacterized protein n=1 Tax=Suillus discolor TaxID=1912936 RepID=A0A9P7JS17_9AGAM|nr:uncharacterized protein F5147DRAFT_275486 [Suillus discolor]KAG2103770.1 hypothetical protein F5147DRAFT_275486 [Suillus discolor]
MTGSIIGDRFGVLIRSHVLYFASLHLSPKLMNSISIGTQILVGTLPILLDVQMFVLKPRLILSVREHHAKLVADSDAETTSVKSIIFQERKRACVPTSSRKCLPSATERSAGMRIWSRIRRGTYLTCGVFERPRQTYFLSSYYWNGVVTHPRLRQVAS